MTDKRIDDGGPAFPDETHCGMSLRDYFAGQALAAVQPVDTCQLELSIWCYEVADAMIAERKKTNSSE